MFRRYNVLESVIICLTTIVSIYFVLILERSVIKPWLETLLNTNYTTPFHRLISLALVLIVLAAVIVPIEIKNSKKKKK